MCQPPPAAHDMCAGRGARRVPIYRGRASSLIVYFASIARIWTMWPGRLGCVRGSGQGQRQRWQVRVPSENRPAAGHRDAYFYYEILNQKELSLHT